jgi:hypothetical protein
MTAEIRSLLEKWRESAAWELTDGSPEFGKGLDQAADELEPLLAAEPPPTEARENTDGD